MERTSYVTQTFAMKYLGGFITFFAVESLLPRMIVWLFPGFEIAELADAYTLAQCIVVLVFVIVMIIPLLIDFVKVLIAMRKGVDTEDHSLPWDELAESNFRKACVHGLALVFAVLIIFGIICFYGTWFGKWDVDFSLLDIGTIILCASTVLYWTILIIFFRLERKNKNG